MKLRGVQAKDLDLENMDTRHIGIWIDLQLETLDLDEDEFEERSFRYMEKVNNSIPYGDDFLRDALFVIQEFIRIEREDDWF